MIKRLVIKDCLGIEELAINAGRVNKISGGNEKGKTSILEVIEKALFNTQRRAKFVRSGADKAYIELETDDGIKINRTVAAGDKGDKIKVTVDGVPKGTPEGFLKSLFGGGAGRGNVFAFNPVDFMVRPENEQTDILLGLLPIKIDPAQLSTWFGDRFPKHMDKARHGLLLLKQLEEHFYEARHEANSALKAIIDEAAAVAKRLPDNYDMAKWEGVSLSELYGKVSSAIDHNAKIEAARAFIAEVGNKRAAIKTKHELARKEVAEFKQFQRDKAVKAADEYTNKLRAEIVGIDEQIAALREKIHTFELEKSRIEQQIKSGVAIDGSYEARAEEKIKAIDENEKREIAELNAEAEKMDNIAVAELVVYGDLEAAAKEAESMKSYLPLATEHKSILARRDAAEQEAKELDDMVTLCREKPAELLATCELPVKGLGFEKDGLTIDGLPIKNLSTSRQVRLCLDIARAIGKDSALKLICVDRLESLDANARAEFEKQIEADKKWQYFSTTVTEGDLKIEANA